MSEDNWSLEGKGWNMPNEIIEHLFDDVYSTFKKYLEYTDNLEGTGDVFVSYMEVSQLIWDMFRTKKIFYPKQDIEALRQKLIEDVQGLCDDRIGKAITSIINRRFGVEGEK